MKRLISAVLLLSAAGFLFGADPALQSSFADYLSHTAAYTNNTEGSADEKELLTWITGRLDEFGVQHRTIDFSGARNAHSFSVIIEADIPGTLEDTLIIAVPLNHRPDAPGTTGPATAVAALEYFSKNPLPISVKFLFLGAEFGPDDTYPLGSKYYLQEFYPDFPVAFLYLDIADIPSGIGLYTGGEKISSPRWLTETCSTILRSTDTGCNYSITETLIARLGIRDEPSLLDPYLNAAYPALLLRETGSSGDGEDWIKSFIGLIEGFTDSFSSGFPSGWDRHYLFFHLPSSDLFLGETAYIAGLIILLCTVLVYPLIFTRRFYRYMRTLWKNILLLPALLLSVYLFLLLGTFLAQIIPSIQGFPDIWMHAPFRYFALKISGAILLFMILFRFVRHIPFPRNSSFYSAAAVLFLLIDIVILVFINLSLSLYIIWAFLFCFFFTLLPNRYFKILMFLLSLALPIFFLYDLFTLPALRVSGALLYSHVRGNLLLAFILLPFLFMLIRIDLLFAHRKSRQLNIIIRGFFLLMLGAFGYLAAAMFALDPYSGKGGQPVSIAETVSEDLHRARITSPALIGDFETSDLNLTLPPLSIRDFYTAELSSDTFLDRMNILLRITSAGQPEEVRLTLRSDTPLTVYDASFPYAIAPDGGSARFFIGRAPPKDLLFELTLPSVLEGHFEAEVLYRPPQVIIAPAGQTFSIDRRISVKQRIPLHIDSLETLE